VKADADLGSYLRRFLGEYMPRQRNASPRTIQAYRDALKLLLLHSATRKHCSVAELHLGDIDRAAVLEFLASLVLRCAPNGVSS
jgi:site-specific recombinase XerD